MRTGEIVNLDTAISMQGRFCCNNIYKLIRIREPDQIYGTRRSICLRYGKAFIRDVRAYGSVGNLVHSGRMDARDFAWEMIKLMLDISPMCSPKGTLAGTFTQAMPMRFGKQNDVHRRALRLARNSVYSGIRWSDKPAFFRVRGEAGRHVRTMESVANEKGIRIVDVGSLFLVDMRSAYLSRLISSDIEFTVPRIVRGRRFFEDCYVYYSRIENPKNVMDGVPFLPFRQNGRSRYIFPASVEGWYTAHHIKRAMDMGMKVSITKRIESMIDVRGPGMIRKLLSLIDKEKSNIRSMIRKDVGRLCFGKTAATPLRMRWLRSVPKHWASSCKRLGGMYGIREEHSLPAYADPVKAAYIVSHVNDRVLRMSDRISECGGNVFMVDSDSIAFYFEDEWDEEKLMFVFDNEIGESPGDFKVEVKNTGMLMIQPKLYVSKQKIAIAGIPRSATSNVFSASNVIRRISKERRKSAGHP